MPCASACATHVHEGRQRGHDRSGDPHELSRGRRVLCNPAGGDGTGPNLRGGFVLDTDPKVTQAGVDAGFEFSAFTLRAPDVAVGDFAENPG